MIVSKKNVVFILFFLFLISFLGWYLNSIYSEKDFWRDIALDQIESFFGLKIDYENEKISIFPTPGIYFENVVVQETNKERTIDAKFEKFGISITWWSLLRKSIKIKSIEMHNGHINLILKESQKDSNNLVMLKNFKEFQLLNMIVNDIKLKISSKNSNYFFKVNQFNYKHLSDEENKFTFDIDYNNGNIEGESEIGIIDFTGFEDIYLKGNIHFINFKINILSPYYQFFKKQNFKEGSITGSIGFEKNYNDQTIIFTTNLLVNNLNFKDQNQEGSIQINGLFSMNLYYNKLFFQNIKIKYGNLLNAKLNGNLEFSKNTYLFLDIVSENTEINKTLNYILSYLEVDFKNNSSNNEFTFLIKFKSKTTFFNEYKLGSVNTDLSYSRDVISISLHEANLFDGQVRGEGVLHISTPIQYDFSITMNQLNMEKISQFYNPSNKLISGELYTDFKLRSEGNSEKEFFQNLNIEGNSTIKNGNLIGYLNFYKPILSLGKWINLRGPSGEVTEFKNIEFRYNLLAQHLKIPYFKMIGVGIDANGSGSLDIDKNIDFRIIVGLGGIAGKALSVPIIYKGKWGQNFAYIDPIWIGTVYFGTTLLGGPVGGIAGSAVSEYVRDAFYKIKNILPFTNKTNQGETE
jgi:hypothetical protein